MSDNEEHCMKVRDRNGNFRFKFGKQGGGDGKFNNPWCLSVNKSGHLMVCDTGNDRMQVYKLNGKFVGTFPTKGSDLGELKFPNAVAVLSNGGSLCLTSLTILYTCLSEMLPSLTYDKYHYLFYLSIRFRNTKYYYVRTNL